MSEADASIRRILRYTITARYLGSQPMMVLYSVFGYATTLLALVAVLELQFPHPECNRPYPVDRSAGTGG